MFASLFLCYFTHIQQEERGPSNLDEAQKPVSNGYENKVKHPGHDYRTGTSGKTIRWDQMVAPGSIFKAEFCTNISTKRLPCLTLQNVGSNNEDKIRTA